jgi:phosphoenolpyruvate carboxylase
MMGSFPAQNEGEPMRGAHGREEYIDFGRVVRSCTRQGAAAQSIAAALVRARNAAIHIRRFSRSSPPPVLAAHATEVTRRSTIGHNRGYAQLLAKRLRFKRCRRREVHGFFT